MEKPDRILEHCGQADVVGCRLLLNGVVCTMQDKFQPAETFFEAAVTFEPQSILAWTMFGSLFTLLLPHL